MKGTRTALLALAVVMALAAPVAAEAPPADLERISEAPNGLPGNGPAWRSVVSGEGRYVAFESAATNLVPGGVDEIEDDEEEEEEEEEEEDGVPQGYIGGDHIYVRDRAVGTTELVSRSSAGTPGNGRSYQPSISADGRFVAFTSGASNLVPGDTNDAWDVFVHDLQTGETERVSVATGGWEANGASFQPAISADGRYVAFRSDATDLVAGDTNGYADIFVHDRETGETERVSLTWDGGQINQGAFEPSISADGRIVVFNSYATNVVPDSSEIVRPRVYVRDRQAGTTELVAVSSDGTHENWQSRDGAVSAHGRYVVFSSISSNLVRGDTNNDWDVFVRDLQAGTTERVSVSSAGQQGRSQWPADAVSGARRPSISADGRYVAFHSVLTGLADGDDNRLWNVLVHDRRTGVTEMVSESNFVNGVAIHSQRPSISADGSAVTFNTAISELGELEVFVRDRGPDIGVGALHATPDTDSVDVSGWARFVGHVVTTAEATEPGAPGASELGMELAGASITARPERGDLLLRWEVRETVRHVWGVGTPGLTYAAQFDYAGSTWQVRVHRTHTAENVAPDDIDDPRWGFQVSTSLHRCEATALDAQVCSFHAHLSGGMAEARAEITAAVPYGSAAGLPATDGPLTNVRVMTGLGTPNSGVTGELHRVDLPDTVIHPPVLELGLTDGQGNGLAQQTLHPSEPAFAAALDTAGLPAGSYTLWARACLGDDCRTTTTEIILP